MSRFLPAFRFSVLMLTCLTGGVGRAETTASGFGPEVTAAERELAERPEPDARFRNLTAYWHGVPGLNSLRNRWERFSGQDKGFAVLAALVLEADGRPEEALERLRDLPGTDARWNEGRLLALLGREQEAVAVFEPLAATAENTVTAAAALLALTELDCIRGEFSTALQRTTGAWKARREAGFRLRILERHLSLLVEAGQETDFVNDQLAIGKPEAGSDAEARQTAARTCAVMADWFTADPRLRAHRDALAGTWRTEPENGCSFHPEGRPSMACGLLTPQPDELKRLANTNSLTTEQSLSAAALAGAALPEWAPNSTPAWVGRAMQSHPFYISRALFARQSAWSRKPSFAEFGWQAGIGHLPEVQRTTLELMVRAWSGKATARDADTLATILTGSPAMRTLPPLAACPDRGEETDGWPAVGPFPTEKVLWNLRGPAWTDFYRDACRRAFLRTPGFYSVSSADFGLRAWPEWRPEWPPEDAEELMVWAWRNLSTMGADTPERAAGIAEHLSDPGDKVLFAAVCGRMEMLTRWCRDAAFLRKVRTASLMRAAFKFQQFRFANTLPREESEAFLTLAAEIAERSGATLADLFRTQRLFRRAEADDYLESTISAPEELLIKQGAGSGPEAWDDSRGRARAKLAIPVRIVPHPLYGLPVCPSVERFRRLAQMLASAQDQNGGSSAGYPASMALNLMLGGASLEKHGERPAELVRELAGFPTRHPIKRQLLRWTALRAEQSAAGRARHDSYLSSSARSEERLRQVLHRWAEEEQSSLPCHLARAAFEEDPVRKALILDLLRARSPLTAGVFPSPARPAAPPADPQAGSPKATADVVTDHYLSLLRDPLTRQRLEPIGALAPFLRANLRSVCFLAARSMSLPDYEETATLLMNASDPLAARMAVILSGFLGTAAQDRFLMQALTRFPEDPELLLASLAATVGEKAKSARFVRALDLLPSRADAVAATDYTSWCGFDQQTVPQSPEAAQAIARFAERTHHLSPVPFEWLRAMETALTIPAYLEEMPDAGSLTRAVVRCRNPTATGGDRMPDRTLILQNLVRSGRKKEAAEMAEAILSWPQISINRPTNPRGFSPAWAGASKAFPVWKTSEGWVSLYLAGSADPAGLADRLRVAADKYPGDEHVALASLLATGLARPVTSADLGALNRLSPSAGRKALSLADSLLPPGRLPADLLIDTWEAGARHHLGRERMTIENFMMGNRHLDRLEAAGSPAAARGILPALLQAALKSEGLPEDYPDQVLERLHRLGTPEQITEFHDILLRRRLEAADHIPKNRDPAYQELASQTKFYLHQDPGRFPADLEEKVTGVLNSAVTQGTPRETTTERLLIRLADAAAADMRWHPVLRTLLATLPVSKKSGPDDWLPLELLMRAHDSKRLIPSLQLELQPSDQNRALLRWRFQGLVPPALSPQEIALQRPKTMLLPWPSLSMDLAGKFDALVLLGDPAGADLKIVAHVENLPASGELTLADLPSVGQLQVQLIGHDSPRTMETGPALTFNHSPPLLDTAPPSATTGLSTDSPSATVSGNLPQPPSGWKFLCTPARRGLTDAWHFQQPESSPDQALPFGVALLAMDTSGKPVRGILLARDQASTASNAAGLPGFLISLNDLLPDFDPQNPEAKPTASHGAPEYLVFAIKDPAYSTPDTAGPFPNLPPPRLILRPLR